MYSCIPIKPVAYRGGEKGTELELFQTHGAGVGPEKQDEGHEGDVGHKLAGLPHQLSTILQAFLLCQRGPGGIYGLSGRKKRHEMLWLDSGCLEFKNPQ